MADLFTHASIAVLARLYQRHPRGVATFVAGTCLPDLSRVPATLLTRLRWDFPQIPEWLCYVWAPLHLPAGIAGMSFLGACLFPEDRRKTSFINILAGGYSTSSSTSSRRTSASATCSCFRSRTGTSSSG